MEDADHTSPSESMGEDARKEVESRINWNLLQQQISQLDLDEPVPNDKAQLQDLIQRHIQLIRVDCADERTKRQLIVRLCELRIKLNEISEEEEAKFVCGHSLAETYAAPSNQRTCDVCLKKPKTSLIVPLLLSNSNPNPILTCLFCTYPVHQQCSLNQEKLRPCPRTSFEQAQLAPGCNSAIENSLVQLSICPEIGLDRQHFKCSDCSQSIRFESSVQCDYDGKYYCKNCHTNDMTVIPARVIHNWDFEPKPVSRRSFFAINYILCRPILFDILALNQMLYGFVDELSILKRIRYELHLMCKYIKLCRQPQKPKLTIARHLVDESQINAYSIKELMDLASLRRELIAFQAQLFEHITKHCESCKGNGFYCELCSDKGDLLFPFSPNISLCPKCSAVFHKNCFYRKKFCPRCQRLEQKVKLLASEGDVSASSSKDDHQPLK